MDKKQKGLVDDQDGEFILNESSTSVYVDREELEPVKEKSPGEQKSDANAEETGKSTEE